MAARRVLAAALVAGGLLVLHELRYLLAYGGDATHRLSVHGHGYLSLVTPVVAALVVAALALLLVGGAPALAPSRRRTWARASAWLLGLYLVQESLEGMLVAAHPGGPAAAFADGGWSAILFAGAIGALVTLGLSGAGGTVPLTSGAPLAAVALPAVLERAPALPARPPLDAVSHFLAGRSPPARSS